MNYEQAYKDYKNLLLKLTKENYVHGFEFEDLFQEYCFALMQTVNSWDKKKGAFSTLLTRMVKNYRVNLITFMKSKNRNEQVLSLDERISQYDDSDITLLDTLEDNKYRADKHTYNQYKNEIVRVLKSLKHGEMTELNYIYNLKQKDIATLFGVTPSYVWQKNRENISKLKIYFNSI